MREFSRACVKEKNLAGSGLGQHHCPIFPGNRLSIVDAAMEQMGDFGPEMADIEGAFSEMARQVRCGVTAAACKLRQYR
jgi:hypothetical protein